MKKKCIGERNKHALFPPYCVFAKKYIYILIALVSNTWFIFYDTWNLVFALQLTASWFGELTKALQNSKGEDEIKWGFELKTSPDSHCVPPQVELEPLFRSLFEQELKGEEIFRHNLVRAIRNLMDELLEFFWPEKQGAEHEAMIWLSSLLVERWELISCITNIVFGVSYHCLAGSPHKNSRRHFIKNSEYTLI